jgi:hypothetical protein
MGMGSGDIHGSYLHLGSDGVNGGAFNSLSGTEVHKLVMLVRGTDRARALLFELFLGGGLEGDGIRWLSTARTNYGALITEL